MDWTACILRNRFTLPPESHALVQFYELKILIWYATKLYTESFVAQCEHTIEKFQNSSQHLHQSATSGRFYPLHLTHVCALLVCSCCKHQDDVVGDKMVACVWMSTDSSHCEPLSLVISVQCKDLKSCLPPTKPTSRAGDTKTRACSDPYSSQSRAS